MEITEKSLSMIRRYGMFSDGDTVLVALSGGPDSVCLTLVTSEISKRMGLKVHAAYVDHGLRPHETPAEAEFCARLCERLGITFHLKNIDPALYGDDNVQQAARDMRYRLLNMLAQEIEARAILTAHNSDDQVETFIMRIMRGTGKTGLTGIAPVFGRVVRPLLEVSREEIEDYLESEGQDFVVDSSNLKDDYTRNRMRRQLIPLLKKFNPNIAETVARTAEIIGEEERYFDIQVTKAMMRMITRKTDEEIELFLSPFRALDRVIARRVLRRCMEETRGLKGMGFVHIEEVLSLAKSAEAGTSVDLPGGLRAVIKYSTFVITALPVTELPERQLEIGASIFLPEAERTISADLLYERPGDLGDGECLAVLDAGDIEGPLSVRARRDGDSFHPFGMEGTKKLQDFFVDEKVPREERGTVPIVCAGEEILWVAGFRPDERFRVTEDTKRFLVLTSR